jgi:hypothetical protein
MGFGERAQFYKHSGSAPPLGILLGVGVGGVVGAVLAFVYAYLILYNPFIYINALASLAFGAVAGAAVGIGLNLGKVRSTLVSGVVSVVVVSFAFYVSWVVWVYALLQRADVDVAMTTFFNPLALWSAVDIINAEGAWSLKSWTPTGGTLWFFWAVEAGCVFVPGLVAGMGGSSGTFCEACQAWCEEREGITRLGALNIATNTKDEHAAIRAQIETRNLAVLEQLGPVTDVDNFHRANIASCDNCMELHALTLEHVTVSYDKENDPSETTNTVIDKLLITVEEVSWVAELHQRLNHPTLASEPAEE